MTARILLAALIALSGCSTNTQTWTVTCDGEVVETEARYLLDGTLFSDGMRWRDPQGNRVVAQGTCVARENTK